MNTALTNRAPRILAVVHNNIDDQSSIGAIAKWNVEQALLRGWQVVAVCRDLDPSLVGKVTHVPLYVPPRLHLVQWAAARATVRAALRGVSYDVLLVHQPQLAAIADLWNVHYLSRAARETRVPPHPGWRSRVSDFQAAGVARLEDRYLSRLPNSTRVIFCSDFLQATFERLYGPLPQGMVIPNPALTSPSVRPRSTARLPKESIPSDFSGHVVGFLGGGDPRKGGDLLVKEVAADRRLFLVHGGGPGLDTTDPRLTGRTCDLGYLQDVSDLLDAVDVLIVPSRFEPFGLVVVEAAAHGVPVLASPAVGASSLLVEAGAGAIWRSGEPLGPQVSELAERRALAGAAGRRLAESLSPALIAARLFAEIDAAYARKHGAA